MTLDGIVFHLKRDLSLEEYIYGSKTLVEKRYIKSFVAVHTEVGVIGPIKVTRLGTLMFNFEIDNNNFVLVDYNPVDESLAIVGTGVFHIIEEQLSKSSSTKHEFIIECGSDEYVFILNFEEKGNDTILIVGILKKGIEIKEHHKKL